MNSPRTMREAMAVQALEEIDGLILRVEHLGENLEKIDKSHAATTAALLDASDKFRMAVTAFSEEAKKDIVEHIQRKAAEQIQLSVEQQHGAMQEAAKIAFRSQASDEAASLTKTLREAAGEFRRATWARMVETAVVALASSLLTAVFLHYLA